MRKFGGISGKKLRLSPQLTEFSGKRQIGARNAADFYVL
jgi:hypothetical protein